MPSFVAYGISWLLNIKNLRTQFLIVYLQSDILPILLFPNMYDGLFRKLSLSILESFLPDCKFISNSHKGLDKITSQNAKCSKYVITMKLRMDWKVLKISIFLHNFTFDACCLKKVWFRIFWRVFGNLILVSTSVIRKVIFLIVHN